MTAPDVTLPVPPAREPWSVITLAGYLQVAPVTVYEALFPMLRRRDRDVRGVFRVEPVTPPRRFATGCEHVDCEVDDMYLEDHAVAHLIKVFQGGGA